MQYALLFDYYYLLEFDQNELCNRCENKHEQGRQRRLKSTAAIHYALDRIIAP